MVSKEDILENPREYTSDEIIDAINAGVITLQELKDGGKLGQRMQKTLEEKLGVESSIVSEVNAEAEINHVNVVDSQEEAPHDGLSEIQEEYYNPDKGMFNNPMSFRGRIRRLEYGLSCFLYWLCMFALNSVDNILKLEFDFIWRLVYLVLWMYLVVFSIAQACKRCHDLGRSGWWQLVPFYGIALLFWPGDSESNEYGENPKE